MDADAPVQVLNLAHLSEMCGGDREFEATLIGEYRSVSISAIDELAAAIRDRDPQRIEAWAHAIKGSSATLGGEALAAASRRVEELVPGGDLTSGEALLAVVRAEHQALEQAMDRRLLDLAS